MPSFLSLALQKDQAKSTQDTAISSNFPSNISSSSASIPNSGSTGSRQLPSFSTIVALASPPSSRPLTSSPLATLPPLASPPFSLPLMHSSPPNSNINFSSSTTTNFNHTSNNSSNNNNNTTRFDSHPNSSNSITSNNAFVPHNSSSTNSTPSVMPDSSSSSSSSPTSFGRVNTGSLRSLLAAVSTTGPANPNSQFISNTNSLTSNQQQLPKQMLLPPIAPAPPSSSSSSSSSPSPVISDLTSSTTPGSSRLSSHRRYSSTSSMASASPNTLAKPTGNTQRSSLSSSLLANASSPGSSSPPHSNPGSAGTSTNPSRTPNSTTLTTNAPSSSSANNNNLSSNGASSYNGPLNTNSPLALAAAAAVTPEKLANLLLAQGPLPIRHITSHLALTIAGFGDLSLSKQRRLIIAALDSVDPVNQVRFDKVGWGRWAARKLDSSASPYPNSANNSAAPGVVVTTTKISTTSARRRRESMPAQMAVKPPLSPLLKPSDGTVPSSISMLAAASLRSQTTSVWAEDLEDTGGNISGGNSTTALSALNQGASPASLSSLAKHRGSLTSTQHPQPLAHLSHSRSHSHSSSQHPVLTRNRRRRRSSIRRARMMFRENENDDDDDDDDDDGYDDDDDEIDDLELKSKSHQEFGSMLKYENNDNDNAIISDEDYEADRIDADGDAAIESDSSEYDAVAGDLELDDEDAERRRRQRQERRQRANRRASVTENTTSLPESGTVTRSGSGAGFLAFSSGSASSNGSFGNAPPAGFGSSNSLNVLNNGSLLPNTDTKKSSSFHGTQRAYSNGSLSMSATRKLFQARHGLSRRRQSETDEEDWEAMGAASLRRSSAISSGSNTFHDGSLPGSWNDQGSLGSLSTLNTTPNFPASSSYTLGAGNPFTTGAFANSIENVTGGNGPPTWQATISSLRSAPQGISRPQGKNGLINGDVKFQLSGATAPTSNPASIGNASPFGQKLPGVADIMAMSGHAFGNNNGSQPNGKPAGGQQQQKEEDAIAALVSLRSNS